MNISREDVIWCYETFLGRSPENEEAIRGHLAAAASGDWKALIKTFLHSEEFSGNFSSIVAAGPFAKLARLPRYTPVTIQLSEKNFLVADGPSFFGTYLEIFRNEIYKFSSKTERPIIIDCGANIGVSVAYFKQLFPKCKIIAIEADPKIFHLLEENIIISGFNDVTLLQKAISHQTNPIFFYSEGADAGRIGTPFQQDGVPISIETIQLDDLIEGPVDFLKIDIEGAEVDVLLVCQKLDQVNHLFVEYHSFSKTPQRLHELLTFLASKGFRYYMTTVFSQKEPFVQTLEHLGFDLQLNISCVRIDK